MGRGLRLNRAWRGASGRLPLVRALPDKMPPPVGQGSVGLKIPASILEGKPLQPGAGLFQDTMGFGEAESDQASAGV